MPTTIFARTALAGEMPTTPPQVAAAAGYDIETLGPAITIGSNWQDYDFFGTNPASVNATQNADGSVTIAGGGDTFSGQLATATLGSNGQVVGETFGGGLYAQATISFTGPSYGLYGSNSGGWPAFWSNTIAGYLGTGSNVEADIAEMDSPYASQYSTSLHDWSDNDTTAQSFITVPAGTNLNQPNTYGFLWVPATTTSQGYAEWFFNGQQVGGTATWNLGQSPFGDLDGQQLDLILGSDVGNPMTVSNVQVWQASAVHDTGVTLTPSLNGTWRHASGQAFVDAAGNTWSLVPSAAHGLQVAENGVVDGTTQNVVLLETLNGAIVEENSAGTFYSEIKPGAWAPVAASVTDATPAGTLTEKLSSIGTYQKDGDTIVVVQGNTWAYFGAANDTMSFIGGSSETVTGGSGTDVVLADTGSGSFTAGSGSLTVTGGLGADNYVFYANGGLLTIENFSAAKGDTVTIGSSLQRSMKQGSDGAGGTLLTFGAGHNIDLRGVTSVPSIQWQ